MWCTIRRIATKRSLSPLIILQKQRTFSTIPRNLFLRPASVPNPQICRFKGKKSTTKSQVTESDSDKESEDAIIKASLGVARNKVDEVFYDNKVRVNGLKVAKKSVSCHNGDEIDIIKGFNVNNPDFLTVARIEILSAEVEGDKIELKIKRNKSLTIDNYSGINSYK